MHVSLTDNFFLFLIDLFIYIIISIWFDFIRRINICQESD
jgi:hypothetical protein